MAAAAERREDVVVIGGGAVGVCCAYSLARSGRSVVLLEASELCAGCSWGNSGMLTTSACAPEAAPGVMLQASRWLLDRDGPFRIRPRVDPSFIRWLWHFRRYCTEPAALAGTRYLRDRVRENIDLVGALARDGARDFAFHQNGMLVLYASESGLGQGREGARVLDELEIPSQEFGVEEVRAQEPAITEAVLGGILYPEDAHLDPGAYVTAMADLARKHGARIEEQTPVLRLHGSHTVEAVETPSDLIRPELVVLANGAWARALVRSLGGRLLIEPGRGFSVTYGAPSELFFRPLRLWEARTVVSSMAATVRITSKLDLVGHDTRIRERRARSGARHAARYLHLPPHVENARPWVGLRPLTPDGLPLIGRSALARNLILATGHGHLGISLSATTGELVSLAATGEAPSYDPTPFAPERFDA